MRKGLEWPTSLGDNRFVGFGKKFQNFVCTTEAGWPDLRTELDILQCRVSPPSRRILPIQTLAVGDLLPHERFDPSSPRAQEPLSQDYKSSQPAHQQKGDDAVQRKTQMSPDSAPRLRRVLIMENDNANVIRRPLARKQGRSFEHWA